MNTTFVVPARMGSKRLPFKNRKLVPILLREQARGSWLSNTIVTTNDPEIIKLVNEVGALVHHRSDKNSGDTTSLKDVLLEVVADNGFTEDDIVVVLYPTYPERTVDDIKSALSFMKTYAANSLLCRKKIKTHPWMCLLSSDGKKGSQVVNNNLYRWQDFPECFEYCHFIVAFKVKELPSLNNQLFNNDTVFYSVNDPIDVDTREDFNTYLNR